MAENRHGPYLAIPEASLAAGVMRSNNAIGANTPFSSIVLGPLLDLGLEHALLTIRRDDQIDFFKRDYHMFLLLLQGEMSLHIGNQVFDLRPGDLAFYPLGEKVSRSAAGLSHFIYFEFNENPVWTPLAERGRYVRPYESADLLYLLFRRISATYSDRSALSIPFARQDAAMLANLIKREIWLADDEAPERMSLLEKLVEKIKESPEAAWDLSSMADQVFVSVSTLNRLFKKEYGVSPMDMVIGERMLLARDLLTGTRETVESIATQVGYSSQSSFTRLFKKHIRKTPGQCRGTIR